MNKKTHPSDHYNYFGAQASWGVTKHLGGRSATDALADICDLQSGQHVLEVGCGVGMTACYLAKRFKCRVTGVDISPEMVEWANQRRRRHQLEDLVTFKTAGAEQLPFEDGHFDAVLCESVLVFVNDKQLAIKEFTRVVRAGGFIGANEGTWLRSHPPQDLVNYLQNTMAGAEFLYEEGWKSLLENAGITDLFVRVYPIRLTNSGINELRTMDLVDIIARFRAIGTMLRMVTTDPKFRAYTSSITPNRQTMTNFMKYLGYGIYAGRKRPDWV